MPDPTPQIHLKPDRERSVRRGHPWLLSGSVSEVVGQPAAGDAVQVVDASGEVIGLGDYDPDSQIRVRLSHVQAAPDDPEEEWVGERICAAVDMRASSPLLADTDAVRLIHSEGDGLAGLTVDRYAEYLAVKLATPAMRRRAPRITEALAARTSAKGAWLRGEPGAGSAAPDRALFGDVPDEPVGIVERGREYLVDVRRGQKTGFYLDQRDARDLFQRLAPGRRVADLFAHTGGFAVAAEAGGASQVVAVESSLPALDLLRRNAPGAEAVHGDVSRFLRTDERLFDLIALDPPPFARRKRDARAATRAYKDLHLRALRRAAPGALVLTFCCSHHVDAALFRKVVFAASLDAGRPVQVLGVLGAPADHPVSIHHPQGEYLTGLLLRVAGDPPA